MPLLAIVLLNLPMRSITQKLAFFFGVIISLWQIFVVIMMAMWLTWLA